MDPTDPKVGDAVVTGDPLRMGDLCYFDNSKDGPIVIRKLHEWEVASFEGKIYRLEPGEKPGVALIRRVKREELS
jgi:hypothetical protein